tara:strand:+ start:972 stop:1160 length:189 start_codon:yes stop_codon:yes gene_type:complete
MSKQVRYSRYMQLRMEEVRLNQEHEETQYVDADDHHVHMNEISYSGVSFNGKGVTYNKFAGV